MEMFAFKDLLDSGEPIRVRAEIAIISTENGGRKSAICAKYRPNHNFGGPEDREFYIGQVETPVGEKLYPGNIYNVPVTFLSGPGLSDLIKVGRVWRIQEGSKLVAMGKVLAVEANA